MDKAHFFTATRRATSTYTLPDGTRCGIRTLSIDERFEVGRLFEAGKVGDAMHRTIAWGVDGLGEDDLDQIAAMEAGHIKAISDAIFRLSGMDARDEAVAEAKNG